MADKLETSHDPRRSALANQLSVLSAEIIERTSRALSEFPLQDVDSRCSRDNLLAYLALRDHDLQDLQLELAELGLSSLGRLESNVLTSLQRVMEHIGGTFPQTSLALPDSTKAHSLLAQRSLALLGRPRAGRSTRIMVTLDAGVIRQNHLLEQLLLAGMDIARINCAHDSSADRAQIIDAIRQAEHRLDSEGARGGASVPDSDGLGRSRRCAPVRSRSRTVHSSCRCQRTLKDVLRVFSRDILMAMPANANGCESRVFYRISSSPSRGKRI